jgi:hypothetical protein
MFGGSYEQRFGNLARRGAVKARMLSVFHGFQCQKNLRMITGEMVAPHSFSIERAGM